MTDERMRPVLEAWFRDKDIPPADPHRSTDQVMTRLPQVKQRGRWRLPSFHHTPGPPPAIPSTEYQPTPIPATNGRTPTVTGRIMPMFSATKAITAGALVFAIGGVLLIAQPFEQQGASVPGAATDDASMAIARFTVVEADDGLVDAWGVGPVSVTDEGLLLEEHVQFGFIATTDPRISGETITTYNGFLFDEETGAGEDGVYVGKKIIANAGGRWIETDMGHFEGVDGYAGLTAVLMDGPEGEGEGVIFPGDMPPTPKDWCQVAREDLAAATSRILDDETGFLKDRTSRLCPSLEMP